MKLYSLFYFLSNMNTQNGKYNKWITEENIQIKKLNFYLKMQQEGED